MRRCISCKEQRTCTRSEVEQYRIYKRKRNVMLKRKYVCEYVQGGCKLRKCDRYISCTKEVKRNFEAWKKAFEDDKWEELDKLMRGKG